MSNVLLNNIDHKGLRVITARSAAYGDDVKFALTFAAEFRNIQAHYPIVFHKTADGKFQAIALLGFQDKENLFLGPDGWDAPYVPLTIERQPFLIGFRDREPLVHIDLASPRVSRTEGEALFREYGGSSDFLERMSSVLLTIHQGLEAMPAFIDALLQHDLLESFVLDVELNDRSQHRLTGFYTINEERLGTLDAGGLERMHKTGYLQAIYMALASLSHFRDLIERRNRLNAAHR
ncbi:MAG TPA: SapC family protein [Steroidobacteraceae bacterium]|jgi:SapC protein|nr:SapC family protein [Steroidobacteraceae bacterium]